MEVELRDRIRKSQDWTNAPLELVELYNLLQRSYGDFTSTPNELANFLLTPNQLHDRTIFLNNILQKLYPDHNYWSRASGSTLQKCFTVCKKLGIPATFEELQGLGSMEDNLAFWTRVLTVAMSSHVNHNLQSLHSINNSENTDDDEGVISRTSWETTPFDELPDVYGDHITLNEDGEIISQTPANHIQPPVTPVVDEVPKSAALEEEKQRIVEGYLNQDPKNADGTTQLGNSGFDWLARLERLLIHFFLLIFDCTADASKLIMEAMPAEATEQIEEIFQLLLKAEPDMYQNVGHIVELAEHWLVHWKGDNVKKLQAMKFIKQYMYIMKTPNYYNLPVEQRLRKLGGFILGLKDLEPGSTKYKLHEIGSESNKRAVAARAEHLKEIMRLNGKRPPSPRLLSSVHFSRVVASILCQRPCEDPFQHPPVYANKFEKRSFAASARIDQQQINNFVTTKYGCKPLKSRLKSSTWRYKVGRYKDNKTPILNNHCWLPIYNQDYETKIQYSEYCDKLLTPAELEKREKEKEKERIRARFNSLRPTTGKKKRQVTKRILSARGNKRRDNKQVRNRKSRRRSAGDFQSDTYVEDRKKSKNKGTNDKLLSKKKSKGRGQEGQLSVEFEHGKKSQNETQTYYAQWEPSPDSHDKKKSNKKSHKSNGNGSDHHVEFDRKQSKKKSNKKRSDVYGDDENEYHHDHEAKAKKSKKGNKSRHQSDDIHEDDEFKTKTLYKAQRSKISRKSSAGGDYIDEALSRKTSRKVKKSRKADSNKESMDATSDLEALHLESLLAKATKSKLSSRNSLEDETGSRKSRKKSKRLSETSSAKVSKSKSGAGDAKKTLREELSALGTKSNNNIQLKMNNVEDLDEHIAQLRKAKEAVEKEKRLRLSQSLNEIQEEKKRKSRRKSHPYIESNDPADWEEALLGSKSKKRGKRRKHGAANEFDEELTGEETPPSTYFNEKGGNEFYADARSLDKKKEKCAKSLWGALPLPASQLLPNGKAVLCKDEEEFPVRVKTHNIIKEDLTGGLESFAEIPDQVEKYKQIFRDEARAKGTRRPSTADVTRKMIIRTSQAIQKRKTAQDPDMVLAKLETIKGPNYIKRKSLHQSKSEGYNNGLYANNNRLKKKPPRHSADLSTLRGPTLAMSIYEHMKKTREEEDIIEIAGEDGIPIKMKLPKKEWGPFGKLHPGVHDRTARRFHGVTSGPFIAHVNREDKTRISISMAETPTRKDREQDPFLKLAKSKDNVSAGANMNNDKSKNKISTENAKLPSLAVREKVSSKGEFAAALKSKDVKYEDKLLYPVNTATKKKRSTNPDRHVHIRKTPPARLRSASIHKVLFDVQGEDEEIQCAWDGSGDHCVGQMEEKKDPHWEMISQMFKSPLKAPAIPLPDNLVLHMEKKYPMMEWPRGIPVAMRYYPSGQPFCIVFQNGAGRVHYPHGGVAALISAPQPKYCRVLVIRDPFDKFYFFDKAVIADLNCTGKGVVYDDKNLVRVQYNLEGGYSQDGLDKPVKRWRWNEGGHRLVLKLNRYMALRILDIDKMFLTFFGNKRGFRINAGAGQEINLMSGSCDSSKEFPPKFPEMKPCCNCYDFIKGRFASPIVGYVDKGGRGGGGCCTRPASSLISELSRNPSRASCSSAQRARSAQYKAVRTCCIMTECID